MSEPQKSRSIQRREAIQRGEEMPTFSRTDNTPDPPADPPINATTGTDSSGATQTSVEQAAAALKDAAYEWGGEPYDETVAPAVDALISAVRAEEQRKTAIMKHLFECQTARAQDAEAALTSLHAERDAN